MNWLHYLLEANLYLAVFYAGYYLFLSRETYYILNRIYLLFSCVASFALPIMQLGALKPVEQPVTAVHFSYVIPTTQAVITHTAPVAPVFTWQNGLVDAYLLGAAILLLVLLVKLFQLYKLTRAQNSGPDEDYKVVYINQSDTAFSFFNYLFIGTKVQQADMIIKHELVHIRQKHSADIIFIELLKIVNWFNPFIYLLQYSLREIHEFIADEQTATSGTDALAYSSFLVNNAYGLGGSSITHSFFNYNLLKKRIIMLHQKRSGSLARLRYLLAIPICGGLLCASTLAFSKTYGWVDIGPQHSAKAAPVASIDTDKTHIPPPPPPTPPVKRVNFKAPNPMRVKTPKGYPYAEAGYTENGKQDITVTIQEKDGSHKEFTKSKATAAELTLLKDKYGYVFPAHLRVPPPPPAPPKVSVDKRPPPPPPAPPISAKVKKYPPPTVFADVAANGQSHKLPPPPPIATGFMELYEYLAKHINYPLDAKNKHLVGNVLVSFNLNSEHKITNVKLVETAGNHFDDEVVNALRFYTGTVANADKLPYYLLGVTFNLVNDKENIRAGSFKTDLQNSPNYVCVVQLNGDTD